MRISTERIKQLCRERGTTLSALLTAAGVSRNAFYSLARRDSVLPRSLRVVCARLGVAPDAVLTPEAPEVEAMKRLLAEAEGIAGRYPEADRDNIRHTLLVLRGSPLDRIRRALGRSPATHLR